MYDDTQDCLNCSHSYPTDEEGGLYCPYRGIVYAGEWCDDWN